MYHQHEKAYRGLKILMPNLLKKLRSGKTVKALLLITAAALPTCRFTLIVHPTKVSVDEINAYLYRMLEHEQCSVTYFKHADAISNTNYPENLNDGH